MADPRDELLSITRKLTERLRWLERGGSTGVPIATAALARPVRAPMQVVARGGGAGRLGAVRTDLGECTRCKLSAGRTNIVFGVGDPDAALMFVGERFSTHEGIQRWKWT